MKNTIIALTIVFTSFTGVQAETAEANQNKESVTQNQSYKIIPYIGSSSLTLSGSGLDGTSGDGNVLGVTVSNSFDVADTEFEAGLLLIESESYNYKFVNFNFLKESNTMKHIAIPLTAKYNFWQYDESSKVYAKGGLTPMILTSAKSEVTNWGKPVQSSDLKSSMNTVDAHLNMGLGYTYQYNESLEFIAEGIYNQGLLNVLKNGSAKVSGMTWNAAVSVKL